MAQLKNKALFFTTSPRTPTKIIPEIGLLCNKFTGKKWNKNTQEEYIDELSKSDFFEGNGSPSDKAFSARDRINRSPKALGFVDLSPLIKLTDAGNALLYGKRPQEIFLRQILKFQLPSPYHTEGKDMTGVFSVRPYLEIMRLIRELDYLTFDEIKIYALQLTNYHDFDLIKSKIISFREEKLRNKGNYKKFVFDKWSEAVMDIYKEDINSGNLKTRQTTDESLKKFIATKKSNLRDYTDACFRYLRYTGLVSLSHKSRKLSFFPEKIKEVDYILENVQRDPVFVDDLVKYKEYLFKPTEPVLYVDIKANIIDAVMRISSYTKNQLIDKTVDDLKDLRDQIVKQRMDNVINKQVSELQSYSLYSEIIDTFNEIVADGYYDAPLMLEYNTWRAMTMLDDGSIQGNFKFDDVGQPLSTAQGNMPDIECDYRNFSLSVEVTLQSGQRQYESEGEPVARHYGQMRKRTGKDSYCLFIAPMINKATLAHFFGLNKMNISYYGGKTKIIPLGLDQFMSLIEQSYVKTDHPNSKDIKGFLDSVIEKGELSVDENDWNDKIQECVNDWLI